MNIPNLIFVMLKQKMPFENDSLPSYVGFFGTNGYGVVNFLVFLAQATRNAANTASSCQNSIRRL
jgi:hypothetical protein